MSENNLQHPIENQIHRKSKMNISEKGFYAVNIVIFKHKACEQRDFLHRYSS